MPHYTYQALIRKYADDVERGTADRDLKPQDRRMLTVMLNLASNTGSANVYYPPTETTRGNVIGYLFDIMHNARFLALAAAPRANVDAVQSRAVDILRNI